MFGQGFGRVFDQIFGQGFDQGLGEGKNHQYSAQYYPAYGKQLKNHTKTLLYLMGKNHWNKKHTRVKSLVPLEKW